MKIDKYDGVKRVRISYNGRTYAICDFEKSGVLPEEYVGRDEDWCALAVVDLASSPIRENVYPFFMMTFEWDNQREAMHPTEVGEEPFGLYDIAEDDFVDSSMSENDC